MKIVFVSGVKYGLDILTNILQENIPISLIVSYSESKKNFYSDYVSFNEISSKNNIQNVTVNNINDLENIRILKKLNPDLILVMGWSQILHDEIISIPKIGIIGSHPTELPKYRGRAPIPWTILKNLTQSALTFFWIDKDTDKGDILDQQRFSISSTDDASTLYEKITTIGKTMIIKNLEKLENNSISRIEQNESDFIEYWEKRTPEDGLIDWSISAKEIDTLIRASTHPYPGAYTFFKNRKLIIWKSEFSRIEGKAGQILDFNNKNIRVGTGKGTLLIKSFTFDGKFDNPLQLLQKEDIGEMLNNS